MSTRRSVRHASPELLSHSHAHAQLVFGLSGLLDFEVAGRGSQVARQTLAVVPPETRHACGSRHGSQCLVLDIPSEHWLRQRLGAHADAGRRLLDHPGALSLSPTQSQLVSWLAASPISNPVIAEQGAALLLASLASEQNELPLTQLPLAAIDAHIDRHAAYPLQVADLARLAGLSAARFHVRFLEDTGQTPMEYVRNRRLNLARHLLQHSQLAIGEIAAKVGYNSQSAFTAALARQFGSTPRALRQACK